MLYKVYYSFRKRFGSKKYIIKIVDIFCKCLLNENISDNIVVIFI